MEVIVVVEEVVSAMASRGRRRAVASDEMRILGGSVYGETKVELYVYVHDRDINSDAMR